MHVHSHSDRVNRLVTSTCSWLRRRLLLCLRSWLSLQLWRVFVVQLSYSMAFNGQRAIHTYNPPPTPSVAIIVRLTAVAENNILVGACRDA